MIPSRRYPVITLIVLFFSLVAGAQNTPIGAWESLLPYNNAMSLAVGGNTLYTLCGSGFYTLNSDHSYTTYSKTEGMSDLGVGLAAYDVATSTLVLTYNNDNIDLFKDNTFYNIPDLKLKAPGKSKLIHQVYTDNGTAYIVTDMGVFVIDLVTRVIGNTLDIVVPGSGGIVAPQNVTALARWNDYFYAATSNGVYKADRNKLYIPGPTVWQRVDSTRKITQVVSVDNGLIFGSAAAVYKFSGDTLATVYRTSKVFRTTITRIDPANNSGLLICEYSDSTGRSTVKTLTSDNILSDSVICAGKLEQAVQMPDNTLWIADSTNGLQKSAAGDPEYYFPDGPNNMYSFDMYANNREVSIAHGGYNQLLGGNFHTYGISTFRNGKWTLYKAPKFPAMGQTRDIVGLAKDEKNGTLYGASFLNGLVTIHPDDSLEVLNDNSIFDPGHTYDASFKQLIGLAIDKDENLWVTLVNSNHQLYVKTKAGDWRKFQLPKVSWAGPMVIDDNNRVFFVSLQTNDLLSGGVELFDYNGTLDDTTDDASYHMKAGKGFGNLPSNDVRCIAKDKNNDIWVGTINGVGVIPNCTTGLTQSSPCEAITPIISATNEALLARNNVNSIAVDDANRKWLATDYGAWLVSADGKSVLRKFTTENSPLPSDLVQKIAIDHVTGDVYFGTYLGVVSYHDVITAPAATNDEVLVYPNPIPSGYKGVLAVRDLMANSDIKIIDVNGQLVYHATASMGGEITWNGNDYTGHRVQSGVYLIFISDKDGKHIKTGKIVFIQ